MRISKYVLWPLVGALVSACFDFGALSGSGTPQDASDGGDEASAVEDAHVDAVADAGPDAHSPAVIQVAAGTMLGCALIDDGTMWCWGTNMNGALGLGPGRIDNDPHPTATQVSQVHDVTSFSVGFSSVCAIEKDRSVWCWGENESDQLGHDKAVDVPCASGVSKCNPTPTQVAGITADQISIGYHTTCVVNVGAGFCWGAGSNGQFGDGNTPTTLLTPTPTLVAIVPNLTKISVDPWPGYSASNACAIDDARHLWCWGSNQYGQLAHTPGTLGDVSCPTTTCNSTPNLITTEPDGGGGQLDVLDVQAGFATCAVSPDGTVRCWGVNQNGELGQGTVGGTTSTPTEVTAIGTDGLHVTGTDSKCVTGKTGDVWCWGNAFLGVPGSFGIDAGCASYGSNAQVPCVLTPQRIPNLLARQVTSVNLNNAAALTLDGGVVEWGRNSHGADGHPEFTNGDQTSGGLPASPIPMRISGFP